MVDKRVADSLVSAIQSIGDKAESHDGDKQLNALPNGHTHSDNIDAKITNAVQGRSNHVAQTITTEEEEEEDDDLPPQWAAPLLSRSKSCKSNSSSLVSLRLEACSLKNPTLETLAHGIRQSEIKHVSLRRNRINNMGAVALAIMIRDYELPILGVDATSLFPITGGSNSVIWHDEGPPSPALNGTALKGGTHAQSHAANSVTARLEAAAQRNLPSPHQSQGPSSLNPSTPSNAAGRFDSPVNSPNLGPASATDEAEDQDATFGPERNKGRVVLVKERDAIRHAEMRSRLNKQIEALPRAGCLLTLDVRSNDIRVRHSIHIVQSKLALRFRSERSHVHRTGFEAKPNSKSPQPKRQQDRRTRFIELSRSACAFTFLCFQGVYAAYTFRLEIQLYHGDFGFV